MTSFIHVTPRITKHTNKEDEFDIDRECFTKEEFSSKMKQFKYCMIEGDDYEISVITQPHINLSNLQYPKITKRTSIGL